MAKDRDQAESVAGKLAQVQKDVPYVRIRIYVSVYGSVFDGGSGSGTEGGCGESLEGGGERQLLQGLEP